MRSVEFSPRADLARTELGLHVRRRINAAIRRVAEAPEWGAGSASGDIRVLNPGKRPANSGLIGLGFVAVLLPPNNPLGAFLGAALVGNVHLPIAAAIVLGMRHPGWFAAPILTKLTAGIGLLWFAFRGEWRRFAIGVAVTLSVVAISFVVSPGAWAEWLRFSIDNYGGPSSPPIVGPPLPLRIVGALALTWFAARTDRAWLVPLACGIAVPGLYGIGSVLTLAGGTVTLAATPRAPESRSCDVRDRA